MGMTEEGFDGHLGRAQRNGRLHQKATLRHAQGAAHQLDARFGMDNVGESGRGEAITPIIEVDGRRGRRIAHSGWDSQLLKCPNECWRQRKVDLSGIEAGSIGRIGRGRQVRHQRKGQIVSVQHRLATRGTAKKGNSQLLGCLHQPLRQSLVDSEGNSR